MSEPHAVGCMCPECGKQRTQVRRALGERSTMHPDLAKLLPRDGWLALALRDPEVILVGEEVRELTAFALAVERWARERCIAVMRFPVDRHRIEALPDPDWATPQEAP